MQIAIDLGIPGLIFWVASWFTIIFMAVSLYRSPDPNSRVIGAAVLCSMLALGTHGLLDAVTWDTRPDIIVWAIWGLTAAAWNISRPTLTANRVVEG
jgi:hypothetical protein